MKIKVWNPKESYKIRPGEIAWPERAKSAKIIAVEDPKV